MVSRIGSRISSSLRSCSRVVVVHTLTKRRLPSGGATSGGRCFLHRIAGRCTKSYSSVVCGSSVICVPRGSRARPTQVLAAVFGSSNRGFFRLAMTAPSVRGRSLGSTVTN